MNSLDQLFGMRTSDGSIDARCGAERAVENLFRANGRDRDRSSPRESCARVLYIAALEMGRYLLICLHKQFG
jgi:hypothetical protein